MTCYITEADVFGVGVIVCIREIGTFSSILVSLQILNENGLLKTKSAHREAGQSSYFRVRRGFLSCQELDIVVSVCLLICSLC